MAIMIRLNGKGITLVELIVVIGLMAVLAFALYPLVSTTYDSWRIVDRRVELLQVGRVGMSKLNSEILKTYNIYSTDTTYIDLYPDWATDTAHRFNWNSTATAKFLEFGTATPFVNDKLAGPLTNFEYLTYGRRPDRTNVKVREINSIRLKFDVSDERHIAPPSLAPMKFHSFANIRRSRERYYTSRASSTFIATDTYYFDQNGHGGNYLGQYICFNAFCDRLTSFDAADQTNIARYVMVQCTQDSTCADDLYFPMFFIDGSGGDDYWSICLDWNTNTVADETQYNPGDVWLPANPVAAPTGAQPWGLGQIPLRVAGNTKLPIYIYLEDRVTGEMCWTWELVTVRR